MLALAAALIGPINVPNSFVVQIGNTRIALQNEPCFAEQSENPPLPLSRQYCRENVGTDKGFNPMKYRSSRYKAAERRHRLVPSKRLSPLRGLWLTSARFRGVKTPRYHMSSLCD